MTQHANTISIKRVTWKYLSLILFLALAGIALATAVAVHSIQEDEIIHESFQRNVLSKDFGELVGFYRDIARSLSTKHELMDILEFSNVDDAVIWARNIRSLLPETIGVALIDRNGQVLGDPLQLRLGKQCIFDLQHILAGKQISQPPVHNEVARLAHFDIVQPVKFNDETAGLLFMSFSLEVLQRRAEKLLGEGQYLLIKDAEDKALAQVGELPEISDEHLDQMRLKIPDTDWQIHYIARHGEGNRLFITAILIGIVVLVITTLLTLLLSGRLVRFLHNDLRLIRGKLDGVASGEVDVGTIEETRLLETTGIMEDVSAIVEQIKQANLQLKQLSMYDSLTGLFNRRVFNEELVHYTGLACRGFSFRLLLLDLDYFKAVNDRYGHVVGDEVLIALADSLRERCRSTDIFARLGGDEFALIMPGDITVSIDAFYHSLDSLFVSKQMHINDGKGIEPLCHISAGALCIENGTQYDVKQLLTLADQLLYEAKRAGRETIRSKFCD